MVLYNRRCEFYRDEPGYAWAKCLADNHLIVDSTSLPNVVKACNDKGREVSDWHSQVDAGLIAPVQFTAASDISIGEHARIEKGSILTIKSIDFYYQRCQVYSGRGFGYMTIAVDGSDEIQYVKFEIQTTFIPGTTYDNNRSPEYTTQMLVHGKAFKRYFKHITDTEPDVETETNNTEDDMSGTKFKIVPVIILFAIILYLIRIIVN